MAQEVAVTESQWYDINDNIITLVEYMVGQNASGDKIVDALIRPWSYEAEFRAALAESLNNLEN